MPTTYAVARPRNADAKPKKDQRSEEPEQGVSKYRGITEDQQDQDEDVVEYMEVDEAALERRKRDMCTPEVSSVCSEEPPTPPAPRASVSSPCGCPPAPAVQLAALGVPAEPRARAPLELPPEVEEGGTVGGAPRSRSRSPSPCPSPDPSPRMGPEARLGQPLPPPHERTSPVRPAAFNDSIIPEEEEDDEDAFSTALYSDVIEDEDLYITVPSEWDGENSYGSSRSGADTPVPVRPHRPPAQVIVIRENNNNHSQSNGNAPRPPGDVSDDRPVPRLSVQCLLCCDPEVYPGQGAYPGGGGDKNTAPPARLSRTAGCRWLATALVLFFCLVSLLLVDLANQMARSSHTTEPITNHHRCMNFTSTADHLDVSFSRQEQQQQKHA